MTIAAGVFKVLSIKKQSALGSAESGSGGTALPRTTSTISLKKDSYRPNNIKASQQRSGGRHGAKSVEGSINADLTIGSHLLIEAAVLRQAWQTAATTGAIITVTAAATSPQFVRSAGSFITDGFRIGDVIRWTGFAGDGSANNSKNFLITALDATDMTGVFLNGDAVVADAEGDSVTGTLVGKKNYIPTTSHTRDYFTIEEWHSDITVSDLFTDCVFGGMNIKLPATGMATVDFPVMGLGMTGGASQVLTTPSAATEAGNCASVNGALLVNGTAVGLVTDLSISVNGNYTLSDPSVGTDDRADVFPGVIDVSGSVTVQFQNVTLRDMFINETEAAIVAALTGSNDDAAAVKVYVIPKAKFNGADKDDGEKGLTLTMPWTAEEMTGSTTYVNSTISVQDSSAA